MTHVMIVNEPTFDICHAPMVIGAVLLEAGLRSCRIPPFLAPTLPHPYVLSLSSEARVPLVAIGSFQPRFSAAKRRLKQRAAPKSAAGAGGSWSLSASTTMPAASSAAGRRTCHCTLRLFTPRRSIVSLDVVCTGAVRFRRNGSTETSYYSQSTMAYVVDIDARTARLSLHAGRLQAGG